MSGETKGLEYFAKVLSIFNIDRPDAESIEVVYKVNERPLVKVNGLIVSKYSSLCGRKGFDDGITSLMDKLGVEDINTSMFHLQASVDSAMAYTVTQYVDESRVRF
jgi:hypothetical protein